MSSIDLKEWEDFFRLIQTNEQSTLQVAVVGWDGPHEPKLKWKKYRTWKTKPNEDRIKKAKISALGNTRFFDYCITCNELNNVGHMGSHKNCHRCMEQKGIRF
jgi:hypothetical protein